MADISKEIIKKWLRENNHDRKWLAEQCGSAPRTVHNWLSTSRPVPQKAMLVIQTLMKADEDAKRALEPAPDMNVVLTTDPDEFDMWNRISMAQGKTVREWIHGLILDEMTKDKSLKKKTDQEKKSSGS